MPQFNQGLFNSQGFGAGVAPVSITCRDVLYIAFREARVLKRPQGRNSDNELLDGMIFLNQLIDYWAARDCYAWTTTFDVFTLLAGHQPVLIGPGLPAPDWDSNGLRPTRIASASVILPSQVDIPIRIRDNAWWAAQQVKDLQSTFPTDLYYEAAAPNGQLWFWPIATGANGIRLETTVLLRQFKSLEDAFIAPQAYLASVTLTLAEQLVDIWGTEMPGNLARRAVKARDALQSNNNLPPRIQSSDWGTRSTPSGDFNYMTGGPPD